MVNYLLGFCAIVAVLYGVYGGFLYLTSGGNDEQTKKAKTIFKQVAIGMLIIFLHTLLLSFYNLSWTVVHLKLQLHRYC
jgi:cytochrome bd-type quinol oxidase subunit 2